MIWLLKFKLFRMALLYKIKKNTVAFDNVFCVFNYLFVTENEQFVVFELSVSVILSPDTVMKYPGVETLSNETLPPVPSIASTVLNVIFFAKAVLTIDKNYAFVPSTHRYNPGL